MDCRECLVTIRVSWFSTQKVFYPKGFMSAECSDNGLIDLPDKTLKLIRFWRNNLADQRLYNLTEKKRDSIHFSFAELKQGQTSANPFFEKFEKSKPYKIKKIKKNKKEEEEDDDPYMLPLILAPFEAKKSYSHATKYYGKDYSRLHPLWLCARIDIKGQLHPPKNYIMPWIPRDLLAPMGEGLTIGSIKELDHFLNTSKLPVQDTESMEVSWFQYLAFALDLLNATTNSQWKSILECNQYKISNTVTAILHTEDQVIAKPVMNIYDTILTEKKTSRLLNHYLEREEIPLDSRLTSEQRIDASKKHLGQMSRHYALTTSQREAITHSLLGKPHHTLAINGPPGTGKTTIIQSIVATLWVEAALAQGKPPIIVTCSANNQAATNVIHSFSKKNAQNGKGSATRPQHVSRIQENVLTERSEDPANKPQNDSEEERTVTRRVELLEKRWLKDVNTFGRGCGRDSGI